MSHLRKSVITRPASFLRKARRMRSTWLGLGFGLGLGLGLGLGSGLGLGGLLEQRHVSGPAALHDSGHIAGGELQLG